MALISPSELGVAEEADDSDGGGESDSGRVQTTAAPGTIAAIVDDAGNASDYEQDAAGGVGSSIDAVVGPGGTTVRDDMTEQQADQRQTVVAGDDDGDGGQVVYTDGTDGGIVGTGPTPQGDSSSSEETDPVTYDGYTSIPSSAGVGDPFVVTIHAHRESGDPSNYDERTVEARVRIVDLSDESTVWEETYHAQVGSTSEKRRLGTVDGLSEGRYRAVLTLDGERADVTGVLTVGGGGPSYSGGLANQSGQSGGSSDSSDSSGSDSTTDSSDSAAARVVSLPGVGGGAGAGVALAVLAAGAAYAATR